MLSLNVLLVYWHYNILRKSLKYFILVLNCVLILFLSLLQGLKNKEPICVQASLSCTTLKVGLLFYFIDLSLGTFATSLVVSSNYQSVHPHIKILALTDICFIARSPTVPFGA